MKNEGNPDVAKLLPQTCDSTHFWRAQICSKPPAVYIGGSLINRVLYCSLPKTCSPHIGL